MVLFRFSVAVFVALYHTYKMFALLSIIAISNVLMRSQYHNDTDITKKAIQNNKSYTFTEIYQKKSSIDLKYILLWTSDDDSPFSYMGNGQEQFIKNNCSRINCYVTSDKKFFRGDLTKFHAIAFNGRNTHYYTKDDLPDVRTPEQKYIYFNTESADYCPVCSDVFDNIFNWTATYKLDSDISYSYILIKDKDGNVVGPSPNIKWVEDMDEVDNDFARKLQDKSKAAAWFVSNCYARSKREGFARNLQKALKIYDLNLDIYGLCGSLNCSKGDSHCDILLQRDYYFYMSFENSFSEDYVTEKILTALQNDAVPVVFGGANYSRFLPPESYIDARKFSATELAAYMNHLIQSPRLYLKFFRWKKYYKYEETKLHNVCNLCEALNDRTKFESTSVYHNFRKWWNVNDKPDLCNKLKINVDKLEKSSLSTTINFIISAVQSIPYYFVSSFFYFIPIV